MNDGEHWVRRDRKGTPYHYADSTIERPGGVSAITYCGKELVAKTKDGAGLIWTADDDNLCLSCQAVL